jgi:CDP-paratose 2-epimerase
VPVAIVTGSGGLIGSECVARFTELGYDVIGLENDLRGELFGPEASTRPMTKRLRSRHREFQSVDLDIRDAEAIDRLFSAYGSTIEIVLHCAAQPSHDRSAALPQVDFAVNAVGTLNTLEATRRHAPDATFVFTSTNKVYGDTPNRLPLAELDTRFELSCDHRYYDGIDTSMSIDSSTHSPFGVSKAAADLMVQEYGRYFGMATVCFRGGCLTGPNHLGVQLHGFLSYLMRCVFTGTPYTVYGYGARQVRDNIHSADLVRAFEAFHANPRSGAVYNIGGGRTSNCSVIEAIRLCEELTGRELDWTLDPTPRLGDHMWWISDLSEFQRQHPGWHPEYDLRRTLIEIRDHNADRWMAAS